MTDLIFFAHITFVTMLGMIALTRREFVDETWFRLAALALFVHILYTDLTTSSPHPVVAETDDTPTAVADVPNEKKVPVAAKEPTRDARSFWNDIVAQSADAMRKPLRYTRSYSFA